MRVCVCRIVNPNEVHNRTGPQQQIAEKFHDHTFGITSDPLTHFGCVLSALVHDCGHPGVTNAVLVTEEHPLARQYHGKSVAEQQSVDLSWNILMEPEFDDLRACIYGNEDEFLRFRQVCGKQEEENTDTHTQTDILFGVVFFGSQELTTFCFLLYLSLI